MGFVAWELQPGKCGFNLSISHSCTLKLFCDGLLDLKPLRVLLARQPFPVALQYPEYPHRDLMIQEVYIIERVMRAHRYRNAFDIGAARCIYHMNYCFCL